MLCGEGGRVAAFGDDDVDLAGNQLSSQGGQPIEAPLRPAVFDRDVLPFNKTCLAQSFAKSREVQLNRPELRRHRAEDADHRRRLLLRAHDERREAGRPADQREELAAAQYSMTSSARSNTVCGIISPSGLAVSRLMTSSGRVDWMTGKSPGAAPFRMRPA